MRITSDFQFKFRKHLNLCSINPSLGHFLILMFNQYLSAAHVHKVLFVRSTADSINGL